MSAAQVFNRIGQLGLGVALVGGVINSALYNGEFKTFWGYLHISISNLWIDSI